MLWILSLSTSKVGISDGIVSAHSGPLLFGNLRIRKKLFFSGDIILGIMLIIQNRIGIIGMMY